MELEVRFTGSEEQLEEFLNIVDGHLLLFNEELDNDVDYEVITQW